MTTTTRVKRSDLASVEWKAYQQISLVNAGQSDGSIIYSGAIVQAASRGGPPRGLYPELTEQLLIEVDGHTEDRDLWRAIKAELGAGDRRVMPFGWRV